METPKSRKQREQDFQSALNGKQIQSAEYYCMNRPNYLFPNAPEQLVDCGVQLNFTDGSSFSIGMDFNFVAIDAFTQPYEKVILEFSDELPFQKIVVKDDEQWKAIVGESVQNLSVVWNWFEDAEEAVHYIPQDIELELSNGKYMALCTTSYSIDEDGLSILDPDSEGEILVLFNEEDTKYFKRGKFYEGNNNLPEEP